MGRRRKSGNIVNGWMIIDKPVDVTSTQVVGIVRKALNARKVGHAGTLDPLASGLLPIALGEATKTVNYAMDGEKEYDFVVSWGQQTSTDDEEGDVIKTSDQRPSYEEIEDALNQFHGTIEQVPPKFSAIKIDGERAYDLARDNHDFQLKSRQVIVKEFKILDHQQNETRFRVRCGKGTYIRSLARDMGERLGCYGYVSKLRRIKVGSFCESDMILLEKVKELGHSAAGAEALKKFLLPVETALDDIPALAIDRQEAVRLKNGQPIFLQGNRLSFVKGAAYATCANTLVALGEVSKGELHPKRVFDFSGN